LLQIAIRGNSSLFAQALLAPPQRPCHLEIKGLRGAKQTWNARHAKAAFFEFAFQ
jgi:hypothetical protein